MLGDRKKESQKRNRKKELQNRNYKTDYLKE